MDILFPHDKVRDFQDELIKDIGVSIKDNKNMLIHAPTGLGKTAAVLSTMIPYILENNLKLFFLTSRQTQHKIVRETIEAINKKYHLKISIGDIISRYDMCAIEKDISKGDFTDFCKKLKEENKCLFYKNTYQYSDLSSEAKEEISNLFNKPAQEIIYQTRDRFCPYELALNICKDANVIISDYNYVINPSIRQLFFSKIHAKLENSVIIFDEAHNISQRILSMLSSHLSEYNLSGAENQIIKFFGLDDVNYVNEVKDLLDSFYKKYMIQNIIINKNKSYFDKIIKGEFGTDFDFDFNDMNKILKFREFLENSDISSIKRIFDDLFIYNKSISYELLIKKEELLSKIPNIVFLKNYFESNAKQISDKVKKNFLSSIGHFLTLIYESDDDFVIYFKYNRETLQHSINIDALNPEIIFSELNNANKLLLMSGTLEPLKMYQSVLNVKNSDTKKYHSPFSKKNRIVLVNTDVSSSYTKRNLNAYKYIAKKLSVILDSIQGNVICFFPSYDLIYSISNFIESKKNLFYERSQMTKEDKERLIFDFKSSYFKGSVLFATSHGSFSEGVDLPGLYLNGVVIFGIPLLAPDIKTKAQINFYETRFKGKGRQYGYIYNAITKIMQNAGRCIRTEKDRGIIVFLDERYAWKDYSLIFDDDAIFENDLAKNKEIIESFFKQNKN